MKFMEKIYLKISSLASSEKVGGDAGLILLIPFITLYSLPISALISCV